MLDFSLLRPLQSRVKSRRASRTGVVLLILAALQAMALSAATTEELPATNRIDAVQQRRGRFGATDPGVYKARITPHWFEGDSRFWYRNDLRDGAKEFMLVNAETGKREAAFDHEKLATALSQATSTSFRADKLPFSLIEYVREGKAIQFEAAGKSWECDLDTYECREIAKTSQSTPSGDQSHPAPNLGGPLNRLPSLAASDTENDSDEGETFEPDDESSFAEGDALEVSPQANQDARDQGPRAGERRRRGDSGRVRRSADGKWSALVKDYNVYVRAEDGGQEYQLTQDGAETNAYGRLEWAPDSQGLVAWRIEPGDHKDVYLIQSSPPGGGRAKFLARPYDLPGDKLTLYELSVFDVATRKQTKPSVDRFEHGWEAPSLHWCADQRRFCYVKVDRGHQRYRVIEVDSRTGALRNLIDEKSDTFIWTAHTENLNLNYVNWLEKSEEMIYVSERDGWRHLYLVDTKAGAIKNQITKGEYVVRGIDRIDEEHRQIWFRASGKIPDQDPYFVHYYRVNFDGTGLVALTVADGNHSIQYSPERKYIIDTYSRVDSPPVHELRRVADGGLVCEFERADISELLATGWKAPEVFVAKGRDGKTDIWGIICRPKGFDPAKKYPVLESIYAGPQGSYVPKSFGGVRRFSGFTDLGFVVVQIDGMGTANRSKAFHDVCWKNLKDAGFPDRILWHKAVAAKYPWYDITRVGLYGTSAGGQSAAGGVLFHPEFYKAAVANSGCHDNRMDKASWNEQWMGYPVGPQYAESSNIEHAGLLQGYLMLIVGEMDENVPPESTFRFVDALIRAGKDFDLLVVPNGGHGAGGAYGQRRMQDFFVRHLLGSEAPNRNATGS